jgi:hypothetical protein
MLPYCLWSIITAKPLAQLETCQGEIGRPSKKKILIIPRGRRGLGPRDDWQSHSFFYGIKIKIWNYWVPVLEKT